MASSMDGIGVFGFPIREAFPIASSISMMYASTLMLAAAIVSLILVSAVINVALWCSAVARMMRSW